MSEILRGMRVDSYKDIVTLYTTKNGVKQKHQVAAQYVFASSRDNLDGIKRIQQVVRNLGFDGTVENSGYKYVLHVRGDSAVEKELSRHERKYFKESLNTSKPEMFSVRFPIYSLLEFDKDGQPFVVGQARPQEILGKYCAIDIEKRAKGTDRYGEIAMCSLVSPVKKELIALEENAPDSLEGVVIGVVNSEKEITTSIANALSDYDTVFIHNAPFDISELRGTKTKNSEKLFACSDGIEPHVRGHGFVRRVWHPEIDFVDTCKASQLLTPNASDKLDDFAIFWKRKKKLLDNLELEDKINHPSPENNRIVGRYCVFDSELARECGERVAESVGPAAIYFGKSLGNMTSVSKGTLAKQKRSAEYWNALKTFRSPPTLRMSRKVRTKTGLVDSWDYFNYLDEKQQLIQNSLQIQPKLGLLKNVTVFYPIIMTPQGMEGVDALEKTFAFGEPKEKAMRLELLDALCEEQLYNLLQKDKHFEWRYGMKLDKADELLKSRLKQLSDLLIKAGTTAVNIGPRYLYLQRNKEKSLESFDEPVSLDGPLGLVYGIADNALSIGDNRIAWRLDNVLFSEGVDATCRYGLRSDFERETIHDLLFDAFDYGIENARVNYKEKKLLRLAKKDISGRALACKVKCHKEHLSIQAEESLRQQIIRDLGLKKDEEAPAIYGKDHRWHRPNEAEPNYAYYIEKFIGTDAITVFNGTISRFDMAFKDTDLDIYRDVWKSAGFVTF